jgi:hypothetical protein
MNHEYRNVGNAAKGITLLAKWQLSDSSRPVAAWHRVDRDFSKSIDLTTAAGPTDDRWPSTTDRAIGGDRSGMRGQRYPVKRSSLTTRDLGSIFAAISPHLLIVLILGLMLLSSSFRKWLLS